MADKYETKADAETDDGSSLGSGTTTETEGEEDEAELGLTENQRRLLYLVSLYSAPAETGTEKERWVRKPTVLVLIYEGIVARVLDYDYAPSSEMVESRRMYFNISQEGKTDLDFLREEELVNGLKISSLDHLPITMYQISVKGLEALRNIPKYDKQAVHHLAFSPNRNLMQVEWDGADYWLVATQDDGAPEPGGFRKKSSVLSCEAVSYVSSAYIPACLRQGGRPTLSNAHRATECAESSGNIRDDLDEVITLNSVSIIVAEYIPFGTNQLVDLNHNMGSTERVQGGFFTAAVQDDWGGSDFHMDPGLTAVQILDYSLTGHMNLEADIRLPEPDGIVQVETFGVSINSYGTCFYGLQLEAVMDRVKDAISLDHLSRLLADVQTDSSEIVEAFLSPAQRRMLDLVFRGDAENRNKVNLIVANEITPHLTAEEYLDKGEYENELKQVVGDTQAAFDITQYDTLVFGANGLLLAGPNSRTYEPLLCAYLQLISMDLFVRNLFNRMAIMLDDIKETRAMLAQARKNPVVMRDASQRVPELQRMVLLLEKIIAYLEESLVVMELPPAPSIAAGRALYERLATPRLQSEMARRITDLQKSIKEMHNEMQALEYMVKFTAEEADRDAGRASVGVAKDTLAQIRNNYKVYHVLEMIQFLVAGGIAFATLDRLTGVFAPEDIKDWAATFTDLLVKDNPFIVFGASLLLWVLLCWICFKWMNRLHNRNLYGVVDVDLELRHKINLPRFMEHLKKKRIVRHSWGVDTTGDEVSITWEERDAPKWAGSLPRITAHYSAHASMLRRITASYPRNKGKKDLAFNPTELRERILDDLKSGRVLSKDKTAPHLVMGPLTDKSKARIEGGPGAEENM